MINLSRNKKKYVGAIAIAAFINYDIPPIASVTEMARTLQIEPAKIQVDGQKIEQTALARDASVVDYLNAATDVVGFVYDPEGKIACIEYSRAIFDAYQRLVSMNDRPELSNKIRVCADMKKKGGHLWIEYQNGDQVVPYQFYPGAEDGPVGVRTMWGTKTPYPTGYALTRFGGLVGVLLEKE